MAFLRTCVDEAGAKALITNAFPPKNENKQTKKKTFSDVCQCVISSLQKQPALLIALK